MPGQVRRSSRWCCKGRAHALATFHQDIAPSDITKFHLKRRASPLLVPSDQAGPRHDRALLHHILKDQQHKHHKPDVLDVHQHDDISLHDLGQAHEAEAASSGLPKIPAGRSQAEQHKGISNGMLPDLLASNATATLHCLPTSLPTVAVQRTLLCRWSCLHLM